jgi:hypothetical protein
MYDEIDFKKQWKTGYAQDARFSGRLRRAVFTLHNDYATTTAP